MAHECCKIEPCSCEEYSSKYFDAIRAFPGNIDKSAKTLNNWRTEIPALFGFYIEDKDKNITRTSEMAKFLDENQDLTQFLKFFLFTFQFPGGHLKPNDNVDLIKRYIRFKPSKLIIKVLMSGNRLLSETGDENKEMNISAEEATYCIFNDTRVTSGLVRCETIAKTILSNRKDELKYYHQDDSHIMSNTGDPKSKGDVTRYAGDILDIMVLAGLLTKDKYNYYSLNSDERSTLEIFANDTTSFGGYNSFYHQREIRNEEISAIEPQWFAYVSESMDKDLFKTEISSIFHQEDKITVVWDNQVKELLSNGNKTTKDIGNIGEAIVCGHEKMRLKISGFDDLIAMVKIVDSPSFRPGYDIESREGDGTRAIRYVEVKTTISRKKINQFGFHMSPHEWDVADTSREHYCVYRLMLSTEDKILYILRNPVGLYKSDKINASPRQGMEITFNINDFKREELLQWKD
jgi:hypothetical protein